MLKMRYVKGEITETDYKRMKKRADMVIRVTPGLLTNETI